MDAPRAPGREDPVAAREDVARASREVDCSLLRWSLSLTLRERLRAATRTGRMLGRFRRAGASEGG